MSSIVARKVKFEFPDALDDVLPGAAPIDETYLVAFSLTMPYLEPYLIRTFRACADRIADVELAADLRGFIAQEAQHFQNHRRVNEIIRAQLGPTVAAELQRIEDRLDADYRRCSEHKSMRFNLQYAEGFEAMTCAMAMTFFDRAAAGVVSADGRFGAWQQLWAWHAAEEVEHRTVAFAVHEHLCGGWARRAVGAACAQWHFQRYITRLQKVLLASQGLPRRAHLPGWLRDGRGRYLRTFLPGYDPAAIDPGPIAAMILAGYSGA